MSSRSKSSKLQEKDIDLKIVFLKKLNQIRKQMFSISSIEEFYQFLKKDLAVTCEVRLISVGSQVKSSVKKGVLCFPLMESQAYFIRFYKETSFDSREKNFLTQVAQTLRCVLKRIEKYNQHKLLKDQWKNTLNAIQKPLCLTDHDFRILSSNNAFLKKVSLTKNQILKKNCFHVFFNVPLSLIEMKKLKKSKILKPHEGSIFEIHSQKLFKEKKTQTVRLVVFLDVSKKFEMEEEISNLKESAELGIIASSIAHDLNNPLAGIFALLQICQKSFPDSSIEEMMSAVQRCQSLVLRLLKPKFDPCFENQKDKSLEAFLESS